MIKKMNKPALILGCGIFILNLTFPTFVGPDITYSNPPVSQFGFFGPVLLLYTDEPQHSLITALIRSTDYYAPLGHIIIFAFLSYLVAKFLLETFRSSKKENPKTP